LTTPFDLSPPVAAGLGNLHSRHNVRDINNVKVYSYSPTVTQSGGTILHLRLSLRDWASHIGTFVFVGGLNGP